jgi:hypothetical protein
VTPGTIHTPSRHASDFYRKVLQTFIDNGIEFLVGGTFAFVRVTGIDRDTKDIDLFVRRRDWPRAVELLAAEGIDTELPFPHWLGKAYGGRNREFFVDVIFSGGNGVAEVDDQWFQYAGHGEALGFPVRLMPVEEMIWSKSFLMERERFDGADVVHLIRATQKDLNWPRLLARFGEHWRVLLAHLVLFGFIYPGRRDRVPAWVLSALMRRLSGELGGPGNETWLCRGTLMSREQYLPDVRDDGYDDARLGPPVHMTPSDVARWTRAIGDDKLQGDEWHREHRRHR